MTDPVKIVDIHYHYLPIVPEELMGFLTSEIEYGCKKRGENPDQATLLDMAKKQLIDPKGDILNDRAKKLGIDVTCLNTLDMYIPGLIEAEDTLRNNRMAADLIAKHRGKIFGFVGIDPRRPEAVDLARQCLEFEGIIGVKWHPDYGYDPTSKESYDVLKVLNQKGGILLTHTGYLPGGRSRYCDLNLICDILCDFPDLKVIAAHMGKTAWHEWAGLAHDFPNLYGDLAVWSRCGERNYLHFCRQLRELTYYSGVEKVLWGTDDPFENNTVPTTRFLQMMHDLPEKSPPGYEFSKEEVDLMLGGNARRLLGIDS